MVSCICDLSTWKAEAGGLESQASLGYILKLCLKKGQEQNGSWSSCLAHEGLDSICSATNKNPTLSQPTAKGLAVWLALQGLLLLTECPSPPRWAYLDLGTNGSYNDSLQAYAAGVVEAAVSEEVRPVWESSQARAPLGPSLGLIHVLRRVPISGPPLGEKKSLFFKNSI